MRLLDLQLSQEQRLGIGKFLLVLVNPRQPLEAVGYVKAVWASDLLVNGECLFVQLFRQIVVPPILRNRGEEIQACGIPTARVAIDFLKNRSLRQNEARLAISAALTEYNVGAVDTLIGDIVPPDQLMPTTLELARELRVNGEAVGGPQQLLAQGVRGEEN